MKVPIRFYGVMGIVVMLFGTAALAFCSETLGPKYGTPEAEGFWRPVAEGLREVVRKRGLERAIMLGLAADYIPGREVVDLWSRLLPGAPWICMAHGGLPNLQGVPIGYRTTVFLAHFAVDPDIQRNYGWARTPLMAYFPRYTRGREGSAFPPTYDRLTFEKGLQANLRGAGRLGLDFFVRTRYPDCNWGSLSIPPSWLAPGPEGPISTVRFEMGREGLQECEARIFIEKALTDEKLRAKLGEELAGKCREVLDERTRCIAWCDERAFNMRHHSSLPGAALGFDWYAGSDWQSRSGKLFAAAARVARALSTNG